MCKYNTGDGIGLVYGFKTKSFMKANAQREKLYFTFYRYFCTYMKAAADSP